MSETVMCGSDGKQNVVRLAGGLPNTATCVYSGPEGSLVIELYDHSAQAEDSLGDDVAFLMHVAAEHKPRLLALLGGAEGPQPAGDDLDRELLERLRSRFHDYFDVQRWLEANEIPYWREFDGWA